VTQTTEQRINAVCISEIAVLISMYKILNFKEEQGIVKYKTIPISVDWPAELQDFHGTSLGFQKSLSPFFSHDHHN
jgi:hypothetical protein